jgi:hypothetical protein
MLKKCIYRCILKFAAGTEGHHETSDGMTGISCTFKWVLLPENSTSDLTYSIVIHTFIIITSLPYGYMGKKYHTHPCFLTSNYPLREKKGGIREEEEEVITTTIHGPPQLSWIKHRVLVLKAFQHSITTV